MTSPGGPPDAGGTVVVALGGHTLIRPGQDGAIEEQRANLRGSLEAVAWLVRRGRRIVVTHGNGPQVGCILARSEAARSRAYELPLDACVAQSQGETGHLIQQALRNLFRRTGIDRPVAALLTTALLDPSDRAGWRRRKPVGLPPRKGPDRRPLLPSPPPRKIVEAESVRILLATDTVVIAAGGGGIPGIERADGTVEGAEAVVDKDLATGLLASGIGASRILDLTSVDQVKLGFGTPRERGISHLDLAGARRLLEAGAFAPGTMGPKIEGAVGFLERGGVEVLITTPERAVEALEGRAGTRIAREAP